MALPLACARHLRETPRYADLLATEDLVSNLGADLANPPAAPAKDGPNHEPPFRSDGWLRFSPPDSQDSLSGVQVQLEVPQTFNKFMEGLMWRKNFTDGEAMIFQWDEDGPRSFWMENTYTPLDIVYVNAAKQVVSIKPAKALDTSSVPSDYPAQYAVEVPLGWCQKNGVKVGSKVDFQVESSQMYIARDRMNFGATDEEVRVAIDAGNYKI